jgi:PAS domain S-box-containing protein
MFGWAESEVLGRANPLVPEEARSQYEADVLLLLQGATIRGKVVRRQHKDGRRLDVRLWAAPIRAPQSGTIGITAGLEDITEERENERKLRASEARQEAMEAELQRSEERMRLAFDAAKIGCWDWNLVTGEMVRSATARRQMGRPEDAPASFEIFLNSVHPEDRRAIQETVEKGVRSDKSLAVEYRIMWPDGSLHWRSVTGRTFHDKTGVRCEWSGFQWTSTSTKLRRNVCCCSLRPCRQRRTPS